jgi:23S rRNA (uracil1939-C5)-methyltransferase
VDRRRGLQPGATAEVTIEKGVYRGVGLARHDGQVVLVPRALPGDRLRVRVESAERGYARAVSESLLDPGPGRRPSPCRYVPKCGGCVYQELDYDAQLELKEAILRESLARAGAAWAGEVVVHGSPEGSWRMRASFHVSATADGVRIGLHEEGSHRVVDLDGCLQLSPAMTRAVGAARAALGGRANWARGVTGLDLAESPDGGRLVLAVESRLSAAEATALSGLADEIPWLTGLGVVVGPPGARRYLSLRGDPHIEAAVRGFRLRAHVRSFFQANRFLLEDLVSEVVDGVPGGGAVLDLYAGVGLFALPLAARAEAVTAVEINPSAAEDAAFNAQAAGLSNLGVERADVQRALAGLPPSPAERVVLDPPRSGAGPEVARAIAGRRPQVIVYVSCDPPTLGRDLVAFAREGYRPTRVALFDLFPDTAHLETVVHLAPA